MARVPEENRLNRRAIRELLRGRETKLLQFHINHSNAPRDHWVTLETSRSISAISIPIHLWLKVQGHTSLPLHYPEVINRACAPKSICRTFLAQKIKETTKYRAHYTLEGQLSRVGGQMGYEDICHTPSKVYPSQFEDEPRKRGG